MAPTERDYAYLAGFVDGEGCFTISPRESYLQTGKGTPSACRHICGALMISQNYEPVLQWIRTTFAVGKVWTKPVPGKNQHWTIRIGRPRDILELVVPLRPHLIVKARQANLMVAFAEYMLNRRGRFWTDEEWSQALHTFYLPMTGLNAMNGNKGRHNFNPARFRGIDNRANRTTANRGEDGKFVRGETEVIKASPITQAEWARRTGIDP